MKISVFTLLFTLVVFLNSVQSSFNSSPSKPPSVPLTGSLPLRAPRPLRALLPESSTPRTPRPIRTPLPASSSRPTRVPAPPGPHRPPGPDTPRPLKKVILNPNDIMFRDENFIGRYSGTGELYHIDMAGRAVMENNRAAIIHKGELRNGDVLIRGLFTYGVFFGNAFYELPPEQRRQFKP